MAKVGVNQYDLPNKAYENSMWAVRKTYHCSWQKNETSKKDTKTGTAIKSVERYPVIICLFFDVFLSFCPNAFIGQIIV